MPRLSFFRNRRVLLGLVALILVLGGALGVIVNVKIDAWVASGDFQRMLERQTSKGLKLTAVYSSPQRIGWLGMKADSFKGTKGEKTIVSMEVHDISGTFNPLGFFRQRWQIDNLHGRVGTVMLQKTDVTPGASKTKWRPWWGWFWPYRVHLTDVKIDDATILWELKGKESGIYHTFLEITPNGHDFEYDAVGGDFKTPMSPPFVVRHAHVLIRKPRLYCSEFKLGDDPEHPERGLRAEGEAGLQEDRSISLKIEVKDVKVSPWLPKKIQASVRGLARGQFNYASSGTGLETAHGEGKLAITDLVLHEFPPIEKYFTVTGTPNPGDLKLKVCQANMTFKEGAITLQDLEMECEGVFRLTGTVTLAKDQTLSGELQLGLTDPYLQWLPTAKSAIFTKKKGVYNFTTIHMSGTAKKPQQDLSERLTHEVAKSPLLALKLFFNQAAEWFDFED